MNKQQRSASNAQFSPAEFFVLRTPKMSEEKLLNWQGTRTELRQQLREWANNPVVKEALHLASPSLSQRLHYWFDKPESERGKKIEQSLTKYFVRMTSRCTPFGLFAGVSLGNIKDNTHLALNDTIEKRHSRLDSLIWFELKQHLLTNKALVSKLIIKPNQSLYLLGERYRYIEAYSRDNKQQYQLSSFTNTPYIQHILDCCKEEHTAKQVAEKLCQFDNEIDLQDAEDFMFTLVQNNIISPQLPYYLTHQQAEQVFIDTLAAIESTPPENEQLENKDIESNEVQATLQRCLKLLEEADVNGTNSVEHYGKIQTELHKLPIETKESKSIQIDLYMDTPNLALSQRFCNSLIKDITLLNQIAPATKDLFSDFKKQFVARYEYHAVPLKQALDDESGIGFSQNKGVETPLLAGIPLFNGAVFNNTIESQTGWSALDSLLMDKFSLAEFENAQEIELTKEDIAGIATQNANKSKGMPVASMYGLITLYANSEQDVERGNYQVNMSGFSGPSAANMLGRFCHLDNKLHNAVQHELEWEAQQYDGAILAEVVHLPEGRVGNVIARPVLRNHEISFLSDQNTQEAEQIALNDLYVYIENDRVKLWSQQHQKEVIPRLSSAHNFNNNSLGIYRFLSSLQYQKSHYPRFSLPKPIQQMPYFPRVTLGKLILSPQRWRIPRKDLEALTKLDDTQFPEQSRAMTEKYRLSEVLIYKRADLVLTLTLQNPLLVNMLLSETRGQKTIVLEEKHPNSQQYLTTKNGQSTNHEILMPLRNTAFKYKATKQLPPLFNDQKRASSEYQCRFLPGDEWLCAKIYAGYEAVDKLLSGVLADWLADLKEKQIINHFFFLRFSDPDWHIRLRMQINDPTQRAQVHHQLGTKIKEAEKKVL